MDEIVKHINDTNASYRPLGAGDAKNTDLFLDNEHYQLFESNGEHITVRYHKENLAKAILFIASILPRKFDQSSVHCVIPYTKEFVVNQLALLDALFVEDGKSVETITQEWNARKDVPQKNGKIDTRFYFNGLLKDVIYTDSKGNECKGKFTIRNYFAGGYSELHIKKANDGIFDIEITNVNTPYNDGKEDGLEEKEVMAKPSLSLQQIFYGAPGTGKSHTIKEETKESDVIRTTFHPDTDYSTFVGAYKPTTALLPICDELGQPMKIGATTLHKEQIVYEFVAQSFLQAYVNAWKKFDKDDKQYLVIEEINRGNCAQIFGDLFQLLDRNDYGFSDYPIKADADMKRQLQKAFAGLAIAQKDKINAMYEGKDIVSQVLNGDILLLPNNLYIWATMNTSDQSLFPIDSAFKRRWDWTYMPISNAEKDWIIEVDGSKYDWWQFLEKINEKIGSTTNFEDKKLGYFFCKAQDGVISAKTFVGKVIFYLWNDVFKDYEFGDAIFNDEDGSKLSFDKFYTSEGKNSKVVEEKVALFFKNLGLIPIEISKEESEIEDEDGNTPESNSRNYDKFTVNDGAECAKNKLAIECIKEYIKLNPDITAQEVYEKWTSLGSIVPHFIETKEQFDSRTDNSKRSDAVDCYGIPIYVARNGYGSNGKADILMKLVNEKNWGITIKKIIK
ncbi:MULTISPECIES: AAA family ATPase [Prevotellaceae]|uniref:AAA family ATPase n=1 Tax=Prevotellaceae TaxID=171552 RepID=UPI0008D9F1A9|nr:MULTISPECIES: AAA family ATPase [Prevotellaceae]